MIILDTNVLSESLKPMPSESVAQWFKEQGSNLFTTTVTEAEILYGAELLPAGRRKFGLRTAVEEILARFERRILPFDETAAREFATMAAGLDKTGRHMAELDAMIAAIAKSRGATIATRNVSDFQHCGVPIVNPWEA